MEEMIGLDIKAIGTKAPGKPDRALSQCKKRRWEYCDRRGHIIYFFEGLIEGFVSFMSDQKVTLVPEVVERGKIIYKYS